MHVLERLLLSEIENAFFQDDELFSRAWFDESVKISAFFSLKKSDLTQSDLIFSSFVQPFEHLSGFMYWVLVHDIFVLLMLIPYQLILMTFNLSDFISVSFKVFFLVCSFALFLCVALFCFVVVLFFFSRYHELSHLAIPQGTNKIRKYCRGSKWILIYLDLKIGMKIKEIDLFNLPAVNDKHVIYKKCSVTVKPAYSFAKVCVVIESASRSMYIYFIHELDLVFLIFNYCMGGLV